MQRDFKARWKWNEAKAIILMRPAVLRLTPRPNFLASKLRPNEDILKISEEWQSVLNRKSCSNHLVDAGQSFCSIPH